MSESTTITPGLLSCKDAAVHLACSERTVWQLLKSGKLPAVRFGSITRIDRVDLEAFVAAAKGIGAGQ